MTRSALFISGDGDSMYSKSTKTQCRRELNVSRTVKPGPSNFRALDESDTSKYRSGASRTMVAHHSVRQDKEKHAKLPNRSTGWTIACSMEWKSLKNPMQKLRFAEPASLLRTA